MSSTMMSYGRQLIGDDDVEAVAAVLRSERLTTGPAVEAFERAFAEYVGAEHAIVCNSGTAALYLAVRAAGLEPGDAVIVPSLTFLATASTAVLAGLDVVFADVDADSGLMETQHAAAALSRGNGRVKAVLPVHLAGQVADPIGLRRFADANDLLVIEDACHALGTRYDNEAARIGSCRHSHAACFSFHPVKAIAMGEGGAITTNDPATAKRARVLRNHGMTREPDDFVNRELAFSGNGEANPWYYEASEISHNFRASDINCALGLSQLRKLDGFLATRRKLVQHYDARLAKLAPLVRPARRTPGLDVGWHLYCVLIDFDALGFDRRAMIEGLRERGIGSQVHYIPVHKQPFYRNRFPTPDLPGATAYYRRTLSLPLFASMTTDDVDRVVDAVHQVVHT